MTEIAGKTVLVTGAASGIGRLMALGAARRGATLVLWDIQSEPLEMLAKEIENEGGRAYPYTCDVGDPSAVERTADQVHRDGRRIDVLVNNAGVVAGRRFLDLTDEDIERTFRVNTLAHYWTTRAFLPWMLERGAGHVVTIASAAGLGPGPRMTAYAASKAAAVEFAECLRVELDETAPGVRTTLVCPWYIDTGMFEGVQAGRLGRLTAILREADVAEAVLGALEHDRKRLYMPWMVYPAAALRALPAGLADRTLSALGVFRTMDHFVGRAVHR
ncbi:MAG TPA: SDR family oxidoreductase [Nocardioidaceae bacterium]